MDGQNQKRSPRHLRRRKFKELHPMKKILTLFFTIFCVSAAQAETIDKIVAKVGGEVITMSELNEAMQAKKVSLIETYGAKEGLARFDQFKANALDEMVLQKILENEIKRAGITVDEDSVERDFRDRIKSSGLSEPQFVGQLAQYGLSMQDYKENLKREIARHRFIEKKIMPGVNISDYDLQKEYEAHRNEFQAFNKFHFLEAFLTPDHFSTQEELLKVAKDIRASFASGKNASALIKQYSSGAFSAKGGDSGVVEASTLRPEIRTMLMQLKPGETSQLIPLGNTGVFIFKLLERSDPQPLPFNAVSTQLRSMYGDKVVQDELKKYLMGVKDQTYVEVLK
jgi:peptidyl-prolyl cis-trans isomerase SurA